MKNVLIAILLGTFVSACTVMNGPAVPAFPDRHEDFKASEQDNVAPAE